MVLAFHPLVTGSFSNNHHVVATTFVQYFKSMLNCCKFFYMKDIHDLNMQLTIYTMKNNETHK
jgi:hypothetical protein